MGAAHSKRMVLSFIRDFNDPLGGSKAELKTPRVQTVQWLLYCLCRLVITYTHIYILFLEPGNFLHVRSEIKNRLMTSEEADNSHSQIL